MCVFGRSREQTWSPRARCCARAAQGLPIRPCRRDDSKLYHRYKDTGTKVCSEPEVGLDGSDGGDRPGADSLATADGS